MRRTGQNGFILVEVLVAIIIISVALTAVAAMFVPATAAYSSAADYTVAANLAQKQLELLKTQPSTFWNGALPRTLSWQGTETLPINLNGIDYQITTQVLAIPTSNSLVEVQVTVNWSKGTKVQSMQMVALFSTK
ncbi:hypothetical protein AXX12_02755 [Anaerosporomusa subterranea]|uniref:Prepilin-type N-terminal cleavage/methylation domain-containing protein n=1 Tax=Anaerosporomusa subterranea TaxID=1794912 RepID=A0A154BSU2_ANASB|nr:prepilin-type N-terminal cleavage/methylation domain-containing protein [Anaerosporomusa subterranea]KYZ77073.1 hypothetical protein AXX12_02755 [Anaerosporomusa subterranea]